MESPNTIDHLAAQPCSMFGPSGVDGKLTLPRQLVHGEVAPVAVRKRARDEVLLVGVRHRELLDVLLHSEDVRGRRLRAGPLDTRQSSVGFRLLFS